MNQIQKGRFAQPPEIHGSSYEEQTKCVIWHSIIKNWQHWPDDILPRAIGKGRWLPAASLKQNPRNQHLCIWESSENQGEATECCWGPGNGLARALPVSERWELVVVQIFIAPTTQVQEPVEWTSWSTSNKPWAIPIGWWMNRWFISCSWYCAWFSGE